MLPVGWVQGAQEQHLSPAYQGITLRRAMGLVELQVERVVRWIRRFQRRGVVPERWKPAFPVTRSSWEVQALQEPPLLLAFPLLEVG